MTRSKILGKEQITQKIIRISFQIYEDNVEEKSIIIAGIASNGYAISERIYDHLKQISTSDITLIKLEIDKKNPLGKDIKIPKELDVRNKSVVVVDDVLESGRTLIYGVKPFLERGAKKIRTAVLVDRNHKNFPVEVNFSGLTLSTTLQENIRVELSGNDQVYLE